MTGALWVCFGAALLLGVLVAYVAHRLAGPLAAPLAVCAILFTPLIGNAAQIVMSDLPSTVVAVLELALLSGGYAELLAIGELDIWIVAAGALGGVLVWLRSASLVFLVAGLVSLTARDRCRRRALCYVAGALPLLLLLGAWQARVTGSPFQTGYQLLGTTGEMDDSGALFSPHYAVRPPFASAQDGWSVGGQGMSWSLPNAVIYPLQLFGADGFLLRPGVGFLGLIGLLRYARRRGAPGVIGRGGLVFIVLTLAVYLQYYYQSGRFLMPAATFLGLGAAALVAEVSYNILRMVAVTGAAGPSLRVSDGLARWLRVRKGRSDPTDALSGDDIWSERVGR